MVHCSEKVNVAAMREPVADNEAKVAEREMFEKIMSDEPDTTALSPAGVDQRKLPTVPPCA